MKKMKAFTLIELMIAITILGVLLTIGIPSLTTLIKNNRLTTVTNNIIAGMQTARAEAVSRGVPVIFCQNNGSDTGCDGSFGFAQGWLVGTDTDSDGTINEVVRIQSSPPSNVQITTSNITSNFLRYRNNGMIETYGTIPGRIQICDDRSGERSREIVISATGGINLDPAPYICP